MEWGSGPYSLAVSAVSSGARFAAALARGGLGGGSLGCKVCLGMKSILELRVHSMTTVPNSACPVLESQRMAGPQIGS